MSRLEVAITLLALYVWQWLDALQDFAATVNENRRGLRRGAADVNWQHTLSVLAAPIRERRLIEESGDNVVPVCKEETLAVWQDPKGSDTITMLPEMYVEAVNAQPMPPVPSLAVTGVADIAPLVPVVRETGVTTETMPRPAPHKRNHRAFTPHPVPVQPKARRVAQSAKRALLAPVGAPEVLAVESRVRSQLQKVAEEAMRALGLTAEEAKEILGLNTFERTLDQVMGLA
jgi:hypothetical protein